MHYFKTKVINVHKYMYQCKIELFDASNKKRPAAYIYIYMHV
jgi:hypothetical protein